jgi:hypothetical protein
VAVTRYEENVRGRDILVLRVGISLPAQIEKTKLFTIEKETLHNVLTVVFSHWPFVHTANREVIARETINH